MARGEKVVGIRPGVEPAGESFDPSRLILMFEQHIEAARRGEIRDACVVSAASDTDPPSYEVVATNQWAMSAYLHWVGQCIAADEAGEAEVEDE